MKWDKKYLADVADFCLGKMLDQKKNRGDFLPYLANLNVQWGEFDLTDLRQMKFESHEIERYGLKYGDIVMCEGGEPGRCAIWQDQMPGMMIQKALHRIRPHACLDHRFLFYFFLLKGRMGGFSPLFTGSTIKHLPRQNLAKVEIDVPPLEIQNKIADILSKYDETIANNRRRIELLERSSRLLYREWFVHLRYPGHEHGAIGSDGIPEGWKRKKLEEIADITMGQSPKSEFYNETGEGLPFHQGVSNFGFRFPVNSTYSTKGNRIGEAGDILFSVRAPVGRINLNLEKIILGRGLAGIRSKLNCQNFLFYQLKNHFFKEDMMGGGAIFAAITKKDLHSVELIKPFDTLIQLFSDQVIPMDEQVKNLYLQNQKLQSARDLLLPRLMNGEINV